MEPIKTVSITCKGATTVELSELNDLQGNLKDLTDDEYAKLRNSIVEFGFSFPVFMWTDSEGKKWIIDAHQRKRVLLRMQAEGIEIPPLPADEIFAKDKVEAKQKLLLHESRYGKITQEGFYEFTNEPGYELRMEDISDMLEIPEVEQEYNEEAKSGDPSSKEITCPSCGHKFTQ